MNTKEVVIKKARIGKEGVDLVKCPYCHLWVDKSAAFWKPDGTVQYCDICRERITKCPVCQVNTSLPYTVSEPKKKNEVWYNPV